MKGQHSRRSVVDLPESGVSDNERDVSGMVHTRLALTEKKYANDPIFLVRLSFDADGLVYCLRNAESFFFAGNTDRPGVWRLIWRRTEGGSEGVIVVCARAHEMRDMATMGGIWRG
jgi:hypothetical protein